MGTKRNPGKHDVDLSKVPDDEPIFILRGKDRTAYVTILVWACLNRVLGIEDDKLIEAVKCSVEMELYARKCHGAEAMAEAMGVYLGTVDGSMFLGSLKEMMEK